MIYFNCTSVFHTFIISYIMTKEFQELGQKACLIIPGHVKNLVNLVTKLAALPFVAQTIVVEESCADLNENTLLKKIRFYENDLIFVGGMERLGMWLIHEGKVHGLKIIIFEEGANTIYDIDQYMEYINTFGSVKKGELSWNDIDEIWKLDGMVKKDNAETRIQVHDLEMQKYLHDTDFLCQFLKSMDILFPQKNKEELSPIVFFDSYALAAGRSCSRTIEKIILNKVVEIISEWKYEIKPHPNDFTEWKYESSYVLSKNTNIPIEVLRLRQSDADSQEKVYISYGITGCITNELFLVGGTPYVIFLYKILRLYGIEYPGEFVVKQSYGKCSEKQQKKIFFPETFTELKKDLYQITGKGVFSEDDILRAEKKELSDTGRKVRNIYKYLFGNLPDELNETSVMCIENNEWKELSSRKILANQQKYNIKLKIPKQHGLGKFTEGEQYDRQAFRWYIARSAAVKVKLHSIACFDQENRLMYEFHSEELVWLDAQKVENGWYIFNNCDPMVEFEVKKKDAELLWMIVIEVEIEWNLSYEALLRIKNSMLERLVDENMIRQKAIQQLQGYLQEWEKEVKNRDEEIKTTIQQRDELSVILTDEREQWKAVLLEKEERIKDLEMKCYGKRKRRLCRKYFDILKVFGKFHEK